MSMFGALIAGYRVVLGIELYDMHRAFMLKKHALQQLFNRHADWFGPNVSLDICACPSCRNGLGLTGSSGAPKTRCSMIFEQDIAAVCSIDRLLARFW
jgi:hypothetical protein